MCFLYRYVVLSRIARLYLQLLAAGVVPDVALEREILDALRLGVVGAFNLDIASPRSPFPLLSCFCIGSSSSLVPMHLYSTSGSSADRDMDGLCAYGRLLFLIR